MRSIFGVWSGWLVLGALSLGRVATSRRARRSRTSRRIAPSGSHGAPPQQYAYMTTGFFTAYAGRRFRLIVRTGAVQSATDVATGEVVTDTVTRWPTIDQLFDQAAQAAAAGTLRGARYTPRMATRRSSISPGHRTPAER